MAWRIVRQPNGLLARFSDIVDNFTDFNMTEDEAIETCVFEYDCGQETANKKVKAGIEDWKPWTYGIKGGGLDRWNDCLETIRVVHGDEEVQKVLSMIGREIK